MKELQTVSPKIYKESKQGKLKNIIAMYIRWLNDKPIEAVKYLDGYCNESTAGATATEYTNFLSKYI